MLLNDPPPEPEPLELGLGEVISFMQILWALKHRLDTSSTHMRKAFGVTGAQWAVLRVVGGHPGVTAGALAKALHVHPSTLTGTLRGLEEGGSIKRKSDPADGRRALFWLTARGRKQAAVRPTMSEAKIGRALRALPSKQVVATAGVLAALAEALDVPEPKRRGR